MMQQLKGLIEAAGAVRYGVSPLAVVDPQVVDYYQRWLAAGHHGSMGYLANHLEIRRNPALLLSNGEDASEGGSILSMAFPYFSGDAYSDVELPGGEKLRFARYALGDDYHEVIRKRLRPVADYIEKTTGCEARICVDTAPIFERYWAHRAGIGYIGRNRQLIVPGIGSHIFLAEIVTRGTIGSSTGPSAQHCLDCGRCIKACPNGALGGDFDARKCLSYLTIEHRGEWPGDVKIPKGQIYGCDICLEVCPEANTALTPQALPEFEPRAELLTLTRSQLADFLPEDFSRLFRGSAIKRAKLSGLLRNLAKSSM